MVRARNVLQFLAQRINRIVNSEALARILMIVIDDRLTRQLADTHYAVSIIHSILFYGINGRIHIATATVKVGSMDMYA